LFSLRWFGISVTKSTIIQQGSDFTPWPVGLIAKTVTSAVTSVTKNTQVTSFARLDSNPSILTAVG
jgi:hypothetical protein